MFLINREIFFYIAFNEKAFGLSLQILPLVYVNLSKFLV